MSTIRQLITERVAQALAELGSEVPAGADPQVRPAQDPQFGDYQSNCAMGLAKAMGRSPREVAADIVGRMNIDDLAEPPQVAGPGFINFRLKAEFLARRLEQVPPVEHPDRMGIAPVQSPEIVAVDMCSPNLAKEMHVGHLRPTIIGDAVARILEFQGHTVHRINHVGDWGTQFGMLIRHLRESDPQVVADPEHLRLGDLEDFYIQAKSRFDCDGQFADEARQAVVQLQSGEPATRTLWQAFCAESLRHCHAIFDRLGVRVEDRGESFYNDMLPGVVEELRQRGLAVESNGAVCIFPEGFTGRDGAPLPLIIQKSDGAYMYPTTDLAALKHRALTLKARRIIYVVGNTQKQHFQMLFKAFEMTGWASEGLRTIHLPTGSLLKKDGTPFKTREGGTVKLQTLLDEAVERSRSFLVESELDRDRRRGYTPEQIEDMAAVIGLAAVKYFELSHNLATDYKFDWDAMLSLEGNTAPYMLYAYARIRSIARKAGLESGAQVARDPLEIRHPSEAGLARHLLRFPEIIEQLGEELRPNLLTEYLYELSRCFSTFYDRRTGVRVIGAESNAAGRSRLRLCDLTGRTLKVGLQLLGIETLERM